MERRIEVYDNHCNCYIGKINENNSVVFHCKNGDYFRGTLKDDTFLSLKDNRGNSLTGKIRNDSKVFLTNQNGKQWYGLIA